MVYRALSPWSIFCGVMVCKSLFLEIKPRRDHTASKGLFKDSDNGTMKDTYPSVAWLAQTMSIICATVVWLARSRMPVKGNRL